MIMDEEALKQLQSDIEAILSLDHAVDEAIEKLMEQLNRIRNFKRQAWENFKEIAHILNDTRARELYYMVEGAARNIKNINTYLERDFLAHFNKLINETANYVQRVQSKIESLKEKGVKFKQQIELSDEESDQNNQSDNDDDDDYVASKPKMGWFDWILSFFTNAWNSIVALVKWPYTMIFGK